MTRYLFLAVVDAVLSFLLFRSLYLRTGKIWVRAALVLAAFVLAVPALLFVSDYLLHLPSGAWFLNFRSLPSIEATSGLVGALIGVMFASSRLRPNRLNTPILVFVTTIAVMLTGIPFGKQLFFGLDYSKLEDAWMKDLCLQTSSSTCVPASYATVIKKLGGSVTERELAVEAGTTKRGTELCYIVRAMRRRGYDVEVHEAKSWKEVPAWSILGVKVGDFGHVVVLMSKNDTGPEVGDPLGRRRHYTWKTFERMYRPNRIYFVIKPIAGRGANGGA